MVFFLISCRDSRLNIHVLCKLKLKVDRLTLEKIYIAIIRSFLEYVNSIWFFSSNNDSKADTCSLKGCKIIKQNIA